MSVTNTIYKINIMESKKITFVDIWLFINMLAIIMGMFLGKAESVLMYVMFSILLLIESLYFFMRIYIVITERRMLKRQELMDDIEKYNL